MSRLICACLGVLLGFVVSTAGAETVTVGGAVVPIAHGWKQTIVDGQVALTPTDLPQGVVCTFTLLGGEPFDGRVRERLAEEWKPLAALGRVVSDEGVKVDGAGSPVEVASRSGTIEIQGKATLYVWLLVARANGRTERMIFIATTPEAFSRYVPAVGRMVNGTTYVPPGAPAAPLPAAAAPAAPAPLVAASPGTFGLMHYRVPAGWREKRYSNGVTLSPADPPRGEPLDLTIMTPKPAAGTLSQALAASWDEACVQFGATKTSSVNGTAYDAKEERRSFKGWPYVRGSGVVTAADKSDYFMDLLVMRVNDRLERIVILSKQFRTTYDTWSLYRSPDYGPVCQSIIFGVKFDDWKEPPVEPATLKGGGIVGVWAGVTMMGGALKGTYAIFFSNGQVFFGSRFPLEGLDQFDTWLDSEQVPRYWGTYSMNGGSGTIKMLYGDIPVDWKGDGLILTTSKTEHRFVRLPPVDGARFNGTYEIPSWNNTTGTIAFTGDGRFEDQGALDATIHQVAYPFRITTAPGGGTYVVKDYTITFDYRDGRRYRAAFYGDHYDKANPSPDVIVMSFNDDVLKKR